MENRIRKKYVGKLKLIFKTELTPKNKLEAIK